MKATSKRNCCSTLSSSKVRGSFRTLSRGESWWRFWLFTHLACHTFNLLLIAAWWWNNNLPSKNYNMNMTELEGPESVKMVKRHQYCGDRDCSQTFKPIKSHESCIFSYLLLIFVCRREQEYIYSFCRSKSYFLCSTTTVLWRPNRQKTVKIVVAPWKSYCFKTLKCLAANNVF